MSPGPYNRRAATSEPAVSGSVADTAPGGMRLLVANEPRSYRETLSTVIAQLRPRLEVLTAEPTDLDREVLRSLPDLVVCSRLSGAVELEAPAWIELYPEGTSQTVVSMNGERYTYPGMDFDTLLSILDHAVSPRK